MFSLALLSPGWASTGISTTGINTAGTFDNLPGGAMVGADFDGTQAISNRFRSGGFTYGTSVVQPRIEDVAEMTIQTAQLDSAATAIGHADQPGDAPRKQCFPRAVFRRFPNTDLNANSWSNNARGICRAISLS